MKSKLLLICAGSIFSLSSAFAQNFAPQKAQMEQEAVSQLGVSGEVLHSCFSSNRPAPGSAMQSGDKSQMHAALLACLQKSNANLTQAQLDSFMQSHRPAHRPMKENNNNGNTNSGNMQGATSQFK